jgi:hypothetical protein
MIKNKILKVYSILDDLIVKTYSKKELDTKILNNFKEKKGEFEFLKQIGDENAMVGIVVCFKFFKSISKKIKKFI